MSTLIVLIAASLACQAVLSGGSPTATPLAPPQPQPNSPTSEQQFPTAPPLLPITPQPPDRPEGNGSDSPTYDLPFGDDFSDPNTGWYVKRDADIVMDYEMGGFRLFVDKTDWLVFTNVGVYVEDVVIQVAARKVGGPDDNSFGVVCRQNGDTHYYFEITSDGYYTISGFLDDEYFEIVPWEESDVIQQGDALNLLRVECVGNTLRLIANGMLLAEVQDFNIAGPGYIGLMAGSFELPGVDILFDEFLALAP